MSEKVVNIALSYFLGEYNCAQSVFKSMLEYKGVTLNEATQIAAGFGGGICFSGQQCGAISGAIMTIGVLVGKMTDNVKEHKDTTFQLSTEFQDKFEEKFGTIRCDDLTGIDMNNEEAFRKAYDEGIFWQICPKYVEQAVRILIDMFSE